MCQAPVLFENAAFNISLHTIAHTAHNHAQLQPSCNIQSYARRHAMLSDRITTLFHILQCSNTDISRFAGCSPSNISRLKSGTRELGPESRSVQRLAEGIYRYADYENMLSVLGELCGTNDTRSETMIPSILAWLYAESDFTTPHFVTPKSKIDRENRRRSFGERLDRIMNLLDLTNTQIASTLNVDVSLVSRYRSGIYHPNRNERIKERLSEKLLLYSERTGHADELAKLIGVPSAQLNAETIADWLYDTDTERASEMAETFFQSIDTLTPGQSIPTDGSEIPPVTVLKRYWGTTGLRAATVRFLVNCIREGGELLLYSDEPMDWMTGSNEYFALWATLMKECVSKGVKIKIIHNIDRIGTEMIFAIKGWFPLYVSGLIEPYIFQNVKNPRFCHTIFIHSGNAAILGAFPAGVGEKRWYDYIADRSRLETLESSYHAMLSGSTPFLKTYSAEKADDFWKICMKNRLKKWTSMLSCLSIGTMPKGLLDRMLDRQGTSEILREHILSIYEERRYQLHYTLDLGAIDEILCLPDRETVLNGCVNVNLGAEMIDLTLTYTYEEYLEHIEAVRELVNEEKNYHLTLLPETPFLDLQVFILQDAVAVVKCMKPYMAFVFFNEQLARSVSGYLDSLINQYSTDRFTINRVLEEMYHLPPSVSST